MRMASASGIEAISAAVSVATVEPKSTPPDSQPTNDGNNQQTEKRTGSERHDHQSASKQAGMLPDAVYWVASLLLSVKYSRVRVPGYSATQVV